MFPSHNLLTLHQWIDHGIANNRPLDAVVDDIVNDRIVPDTQSNLEVTEERPGIDLLESGTQSSLGNMYYNNDMGASLCMQTPFGEGRVERETMYEGSKFYVIQLKWGKAFLHEKEVHATRISLSPPPEIFDNFRNASNQPNRLPSPPLLDATSAQQTRMFCFFSRRANKSR